VCSMSLLALEYVHVYVHVYPGRKRDKPAIHVYQFKLEFLASTVQRTRLHRRWCE
jgi:hypothetical protein